MAGDYIPQPDGDFNAWETNFVTYVGVNTAALGLLPADVTPLTAAQTAWNTGYSGHVTAQAAAESATENKDDKRKAFEGVIRPLVNRLQASTTVTDAQRQAMGITVRDTHHTPVGPPTTRPVADVTSPERLRHVIRFGDESTPNSKAKPAGAIGAEIWMKIATAPPTDPAEFTFVALDTRTPYTLDFPSVDGGKTVYYLLRWVNTKGQKGPWSATYSGTVLA
jgi:hypothetical protein